jgi:hypothetical protein
MSRTVSGVLITVAAFAGIYAAAATATTHVAATFVTAEAASHSRNEKFVSAARRTSAGLGAARARCDALVGDRQRVCRAEARANEQRAFRAAQL